MTASRQPRARRALLACGALAGALAAQTSVVIPAEFGDTDAPALGEIAGFTQAFRQEVLLHPDELAALRGREITALWVRRDARLQMPFRGGKAELTVKLSDRARHPSAATARFADNHGPQPVEVFRGAVTLPESPQPHSLQLGWAPPNAVAIEFTTPFRYRDGSLCIEIQGHPVVGQQSPMWPVDDASWQLPGTTMMAGMSCDQHLSAMAVATTLLPGSVVTMYASGPTLSTGVCLLGRERPQPLDLSAQGAPGCLVRVDPIEALPFVFPRVKRDPMSRVEKALTLPVLNCFLGERLAIQWLQMPNAGNKARLATTHVQLLRLADSIPAYPGATVRTGALPAAVMPELGEVQPSHMPVLRFVVK